MLKPQYEMKIAKFRELHSRGRLLLNNAWDVMSARLAAAAGDQAIATTSAGVAWSLGFPDGHVASRAQVIENARAIVAGTDLPVTIDIENGLLKPGETFADLVRDLISAGVAGINIEDSDKGASLAPEDAARRLRDLRAAAESADFGLFINARMDALLLGETSDADVLIQRAATYLAAGADCVFIPGLADLSHCRRIAAALSGPLNVMALPDGPSAADLFETGVTRVSAGSFHAEAAYGHVRALMRDFRASGRLHADRANHFGYAEANDAAKRPF